MGIKTAYGIGGSTSFRLYVDGDSFALGEWLYDPVTRKNYKANTAGIQNGTFGSNIALWTEIGSFGLFSATSTQFMANVVGGSALSAAPATATIPGLLPDAANTGTGIGSAANDKLSLIANGKEMIRLDGVGSNRNITFEGNVNIGQGAGAPTPNTLSVVGGQGPNVGGRATGQLVVKSSGTGANDTAVLTGHSSFNGDTQQWYLGGVSSSNQHIAFINRMNAEFQIYTNNMLRMAVTATGSLFIEGTTGALRLSRMTNTQRDNMTNWEGMMLFNTTTNKYNVVEQGLWKELLTGPLT